MHKYINRHDNSNGLCQKA